MNSEGVWPITLHSRVSFWYCYGSNYTLQNNFQLVTCVIFVRIAGRLLAIFLASWEQLSRWAFQQQKPFTSKTDLIFDLRDIAPFIPFGFAFYRIHYVGPQSNTCKRDRILWIYPRRYLMSGDFNTTITYWKMKIKKGKCFFPQQLRCDNAQSQVSVPPPPYSSHLTGHRREGVTLGLTDLLHRWSSGAFDPRGASLVTGPRGAVIMSN